MQKKKNKITLEEKIMLKIKRKEVKMKPRWYFVLGSVLFLVSLVILSVGVMFLFNLMFFALRMQGPMASWRMSMALSHFPWWGLALSLVGLVAGVKLLKRYDFSYKKNSGLIMIIFVLVMVAAGLLFDRIGLNERLMRKRPRIQKFYFKNRSMPATYLDMRFKVRGI
jgi:hypothetical protein